LAENLIHCEQILSQDALPIFPWAGYVAGEKHLNPEPRKSDQSECDERAFLPHVGVLHLCASSIAERRAHCELANCLMKTGHNAQNPSREDFECYGDVSPTDSDRAIFRI
jgi:hypothetical protein